MLMDCTQTTAVFYTFQCDLKMFIFQSRRKKKGKKISRDISAGFPWAFWARLSLPCWRYHLFLRPRRRRNNQTNFDPPIDPPAGLSSSLAVSLSLSLWAASLDLIHNLYSPHHHHHLHGEEEDTLHQHSLKPREFSWLTLNGPRQYKSSFTFLSPLYPSLSLSFSTFKFSGVCTYQIVEAIGGMRLSNPLTPLDHRRTQPGPHMWTLPVLFDDWESCAHTFVYCTVPVHHGVLSSSSSSLFFLLVLCAQHTCY